MRALGFPVKKAEVLRIMKEVDKDGSGEIEYPEFIEIMTERTILKDPDDEIRK